MNMSDKDMCQYKIAEVSADDRHLIEQAREATNLSYSPYSRFAVGAAVLLSNGQVVKGANQENASYPVGICAERSALCTAQNLFPGISVEAIALAARNDKGEYTEKIITPCGMCRQALSELEMRYDKEIRILMSSADEALVVRSVKALLPFSFQ